VSIGYKTTVPVAPAIPPANATRSFSITLTPYWYCCDDDPPRVQLISDIVFFRDLSEGLSFCKLLMRLCWLEVFAMLVAVQPVEGELILRSFIDFFVTLR